MAATGLRKDVIVPTYLSPHGSSRAGGANVALLVGELFLACCLRGMEVTRHFTPELGLTIALMLGFALIAGGAVYVIKPVLVSR